MLDAFDYTQNIKKTICQHNFDCTALTNWLYPKRDNKKIKSTQKYKKSFVAQGYI